MTIRILYRGSMCRLLCVLLAFTMAAAPSASALAQEPQLESADIEFQQGQATVDVVVEQPTTHRVSGDTTLLAQQVEGKLDANYVTPQSVFYLAARPRQFLTSPNAALYPTEVITAAGLQHLGIDPLQVEEITAFVEPPTIMGVSFGVILKFTEPFDAKSLTPNVLAHTEPSTIDDKPYHKSTKPQLPSIYMPDERTLIFAPETTLRRRPGVERTPPTSPLIERVTQVPANNDLYASIDIESLRPLINPWLNVAVMKQREKFPEEAKPFLEIPNLVSTVDFTLNLSHTGPTALVLHANDEASAEKLEGLYDLAKELQRKQMEQQSAQLQQSEDPIQRAMGQYMDRVSKINSDAYAPERKGDSIILFNTDLADQKPQDQLVLIAVSGVLVALILPAIQAAREAARRNQSMSSMKQIMLAALVHADAKRTLPPNAIYSADGKPLLSWRVAILPYLDQQELYNQFRLDEPWDSEHNRTLIAQMPAIYANPNVPEPGKTNYLALVGKECIMDGRPVGMSFAGIRDGTSKTILFVEADADRAVEWTKPADIEFDPNNPATGFGNLRPGGCNAAWCDGHISFVPNETDPRTLKAIMTRSGGEVTPDF